MKTFLTLATSLMLMSMMTGMPSWASAEVPPRLPTDAIPQGVTSCIEDDSQKRGTCAVWASPSSGMWMQFYHRGELVLIRNLYESGAGREDVWVRPGWNTY